MSCGGSTGRIGTTMPLVGASGYARVAGRNVCSLCFPHGVLAFDRLRMDESLGCIVVCCAHDTLEHDLACACFRAAVARKALQAGWVCGRWPEACCGRHICMPMCARRVPPLSGHVAATPCVCQPLGLHCRRSGVWNGAFEGVRAAQSTVEVMLKGLVWRTRAEAMLKEIPFTLSQYRYVRTRMSGHPEWSGRAGPGVA